MEWLDIVDEDGNPTGEIVEREKAHAEGIRHRTSHVWIVRKRNDKVEILLQKRCKTKDSHPGCYDISSAGHIPAGVDFLASAVRELKEELGVTAEESELVYCGARKGQYQAEFYGKLFIDNQVSNVYLLWRDMEESDFVLQESEVESVCFMEFEECYQKIKNKEIPNCIVLKELDMLRKQWEYNV